MCRTRHDDQEAVRSETGRISLFRLLELVFCFPLGCLDDSLFVWFVWRKKEKKERENKTRPDERKIRPRAQGQGVGMDKGQKEEGAKGRSWWEVVVVQQSVSR